MRSVCDLYGSNSLTWGEPKEVPGGATITLIPVLERRSGITQDAAPAIEFILSITGTVALSVLSNYIYDKLKSSKYSVKASINRRITEIDAGEIKRIIEEEIRVDWRA